ncbi:MAG TPA: amidase [Dongiaceae bacterium]
MSDLDLCYMSASEALQHFKAKTLSPVDLMQAVIDRAEQVQPQVNAFAHCHYDEAMDQARRAEARYQQGNGNLRPLEGLPIGLKDEAGWQDHPVTVGSLLLKDEIARENTPTTERVLESGAIIHAQTTVPEFCCASVTWSRLWGVTHSPWNLNLTCGGSSGGSGAALASGMTTLATGSDIGGSIRIPAACSGVVGFKPPYGRNPSEMVFNLDRYNHNGPMARSVADCALLQNTMSGPHPKDIASLRPKLDLPTTFAGIKGWRIAYSEDLGYFRVSDEMRRHLREVAAALRAAGAIVEEVKLDWNKDVIKAAQIHLGGMFGGWISQFLDRREDMTTYARHFAETGTDITTRDLLTGTEIEGRMYVALSEVFAKYQALICPTLADTPIKADFDPTKDQAMIAGQPGDWLFDWCMTYPFNAMSRCPVLVVPFQQTSSGIPFGVQIVGQTFDDVSVFRIGAALEDQSPWYHRKDRRPSL